MSKKTYFNPEIYCKGQEHCLCIRSDGGNDLGSYDFDIAYSTGVDSPTRHFETSATVEDGLYRGDTSLATAKVKLSLTNSLQINVQPTIDGQVYSATLYCSEKWAGSRSYFSPFVISANVNSRVEFDRNPKSGTPVQLVLEGYGNNGKPFYMFVEGVMP